MEIIVDRTKCTGLGICESLAPDVFEVDDNGALVVKNPSVSDAEREDVEAAVAGCPTEALRLQG